MASKIRLGCLHAHHSNIPYIDGIISPETVEAIHFVEPGLLQRIGSDPSFDNAQAEQQVRRQLDWMAGCNLDAILVTCTNYIATLPDEPLGLNIPIVKIDEPFFAYLLEQEAPHLLVFANPATVEGTMRRLQAFAARAGRTPEIEVEVIPGIFALFMAGKTAEYTDAVAARLRELAQSGAYRSLSVGQLSMVDSARRVAAETGAPIGDPLQPLLAHLDEKLTTATGV
jgi:hypothetical protein